MVSVPVRVPATFGSTLTVTPPDPVPLAGPEIDSQESLATAVHRQPEVEAAILTNPEPPEAFTEDDPGDMLNPHDVPNCVRLNVSP